MFVPDYQRPTRRNGPMRLGWLVPVIAAAIVVLILIPQKRWLPRRTIIESLKAPSPPLQWTATGVTLADGRTHRWVDVANVDPSATILAELAAHGLEISKGRLYGLIPVHHWCGNDAVGLHWARVDVERLLSYRGDAETSNAAWQRVVDEYRWPRQNLPMRWDPGDQSSFVAWCKLVDANP